MISPSLEEALLRFRSPQVDSFLKKKKKIGREGEERCVCVYNVCMYVCIRVQTHTCHDCHMELRGRHFDIEHLGTTQIVSLTEQKCSHFCLLSHLTSFSRVILVNFMEGGRHALHRAGLVGLPCFPSCQSFPFPC